MERPPERITLTGPLSGGRAPFPPAKAPPAGLPAGLMPAALLELRSAAATYDYLRSTGDPTEFWETLRLARNHRGIPVTEEAEPGAPSPAAAESIGKALDDIRERFAERVSELRLFLDGTPGLPEPADRFEMSLAFLMASSRENDFIAVWLKDPDKHRDKAVDKLRSLAAITDPYREALKPWSLDPT